MTISYQWLMDYLPKPVQVADLSNILTSIGLEVEAVERIEAVKGSLEGLQIGEVLTCEKHPNADKLKVTTVSLGGAEVLHIVCGAPNVAVGQKVVVAPVGAFVHPVNGNSFEIKKAKIRGELSEGMLCAADEIGLGNDHEGILILPNEVETGKLAAQYFDIPEPDFAIHIGLTPNRSDAMSHFGVARDVCAYLSHHQQQSVLPIAPTFELPQAKLGLSIDVHVHDADACPRYAGVSISNIKIKESPDWLQQRLKAIGLRPINNVVDVTNYVLHEYGQPLHAFDADKIRGKEINVKLLPPDTSFLSLDEKERKLNGSELMICDQTAGMCMAGVFGGANSGVSATTTAIFLESAYFNPTVIRRASLFHGLRTDAATHFEKGVDVNYVIPAMLRAAALICELTGGVVSSEVVDLYPNPLPLKSVSISYEYIARLSGKTYTQASIEQILVALGFVIESKSEDGLVVRVPSNKSDVSQPADIVEEILRIDGLDNIVIPERLNISLVPPVKNDRALKEQFAEMLCGIGFQEIVTNSIVNSKYYTDRNDLVQMLNSLSSELDVMRPSMLESGLEVIQYNNNRKNNDLLLFEFGSVYAKRKEKFFQQQQLALWITGNVQPAQWNQSSIAADLYFIKGVVQNLFSRAGLQSLKVEYQDGQIFYKHKNQLLATLFQTPTEKLKLVDVRQPVFFALIEWEAVVQLTQTVTTKYQEVPKYPAVQRDLALVLDRVITYQQVEQATRKLNLSALRSFSLFDVFESEKLGANKKSFALSFTFQLEDRTLTDAETDHLMQQLKQTYVSELQAQIRS
ncbi:MAG: phenylalanine--tRNA ligase subunit beta [Bacteroidetes bacterium]|nr:phenylalanine--tRNA ligase subunit beta [Bacteroidota bacterium]MBS1740318.1 phenylalanine--tRNA ligase subunit beta [Bacteroidota bacterium]